MNYIDLGLPSGILWADTNEDGFYAYDEAVSKFGSKLPTKGQWEELKNSCRWTWQGNGYKVVGPNGNSIFLPAKGLHTCFGDIIGVGSVGFYWFSPSNGSDIARYFYFNSIDAYMGIYFQYYGLSVRLVKNTN